MTQHRRTYVSPIDASVVDLDLWHRRSGAFQRLAPPWADITMIAHQGSTNPGDTNTFSVRLAGPLKVTWHVRHEAVADGFGFADRQLDGPFAEWVHERRFLPDGVTAVLEDRLRYELPLGSLGDRMAHRKIGAEIDRIFTLRHQRTRADLHLLRRYQEHKPLRILLAGGSGLVGSRLWPFLGTQGHEVVRLVREGRSQPNTIPWDPERGELDATALEGFDAVISLGGVSIAGGRWSDARKAAIRASRVDATRLLASTLGRLERKPRVFVSTSAVGFYGDAGETQLDETSLRGEGFLADVCAEWEGAADPAREAGIRVAHPRFGVVLAGEGGLLPLIALAFRTGTGGPIGSGDQYMSWVGLDDLVGILLECAVNEQLHGPVNACAPQAITNHEFSTTLGRVLHRPSFLRMPSQVARTAGGQLVDELILASQRVKPAALEQAGFPFAWGDLEQALRHELGRFRREDTPGEKVLPRITG